MGKINRFMEPQDRNVTDTYVSQYVPLPFKAMKARTMEMDKGAKDAQKGISDLTNSLEVDVNIKDREYLKGMHEGVNQQVNQALDENNGDWYKLNGLANKIGQNLQYELNYGTTKTAIENRQKELNSRKAISESPMTSTDKQSGLQYQQDKYNYEGGAESGASWEELQTYEASDLVSKANKLIDS